jgi:hypothetical protein
MAGYAENVVLGQALMDAFDRVLALVLVSLPWSKLKQRTEKAVRLSYPYRQESSINNFQTVMPSWRHDRNSHFL